MKKILLIEDNDIIRENTSEILELAHYKVLTAKNGKIGVELAQSEKPDLIICDIMMPVLDGYGVLHLLSKNDETASIPFIFLTAKAERTDFRKGMEMGADDYVTKPFDDIELLNAVESRLKKSELLKKEFSKNMEGLNEFLTGVRGLDELKKISEQREVRNYKKKEIIFSEGNCPRGVYFVNNGKVKTYKTHEGGKEFITGLFGEGSFLGFLSLLEESDYSESASAMEESELCLIPKEDFYSLIYKNSEVSKKFIRMLSGNLAEKEDQLLRLAYNSVRKRVAESLVDISIRFNKKGMENFTISMSREDLASISGMATETVIRTLSDFKDEKLIAIAGGKITILALEKLKGMKN